MADDLPDTVVAGYTKELALFHSQPAKQAVFQQVAADQRRCVSAFRSKLAPQTIQWDNVVSEAHHRTLYRSQASTTRMLEASKSDIFRDWKSPTGDEFPDAWVGTIEHVVKMLHMLLHQLDWTACLW